RACELPPPSRLSALLHLRALRRFPTRRSSDLGTRYCMAQNDLPAIKDGDKRVLVVDGEPVPYCLARIPQGGETRGNLAAGGRGEPRPLTESDWKIARQIGPTLKEKGLIFVGLESIGDRATEITVHGPTGRREIEGEI